MSSLNVVVHIFAVLACQLQAARALVHGVEGAGARAGPAPPPPASSAANSSSGLRRSSYISGWTKVFSCSANADTDRLLFSASEILSMAASATRVKYCLYGSTTDCVTSIANTFPIVNLRGGYPTSQNPDGSFCDASCTNSVWEDDDPAAGLAVPEDLYSACGSTAWGPNALTGPTPLHHACGNGPGLHLLATDGDVCCFHSGTCTAGASEAGVEMYLDVTTEIPGWTKVLACNENAATDRLLYTAAEIQEKATHSTRVKYCLYGSTTNCVTSVANSFPITSVRLGYPTSHDNGVSCGSSCVNSVWEDDNPAGGLTVPGDIYAECGTWTTGALTGAVNLHHACNNQPGLHLSVSDGESCCWFSGWCTQGGSESGVEMYLDYATPSPTLSPTSSPTASPTTATPTSSPTASPTTAAPTPSPTSAPTTAPTASPTASPTTAAPTSSPTSSPTAAAPAPPPPSSSSFASALGDPHIQNVRGERFDLFRPGNFTLLLVPRGAADIGATKLRVDGHAKAEGGGGCARHYIDALGVAGAWAAEAAAARAGGGRSLTFTARRKYGSPLHPRHTQAWVFGPGLRLVVSNGVTDTGVTFLNIRLQNLDKAGVPIGGLLGGDDYNWATEPDRQCGGQATSLIAMGSEVVKEGAGDAEGPQVVASYGAA